MLLLAGRPRHLRQVAQNCLQVALAGLCHRGAELAGYGCDRKSDDARIDLAGLHKGDYQEIRMNVNDMVAAMAAKTVDAMVNVEPYNAIAEADGLAVSISEFYDFDKLPVFMAATPEFVEKNPDTIVAYLKAWLDVAKDFKNEPQKVADSIYGFYTSKGYKMSKETFAKALNNVEVGPGWPDDLDAYMKHHAEVLLAAKKVKAIPDWNKAFRKDFM